MEISKNGSELTLNASKEWTAHITFRDIDTPPIEEKTVQLPGNVRAAMCDDEAFVRIGNCILAKNEIKYIKLEEAK